MTSAAIRPPLSTPLLQDSAAASSHSPAEAQTREVLPINAGGYSWHNDEVDQVIRQSGEADAGRIISEAILHDNGDHKLDSKELAAAGENLIKESMESYQWSPSALAKIMVQKKVGNQRALLQRARHLDDGDHWLSEAELREAAQTLSRITPAFDVGAIQQRIDSLSKISGVHVDTLGAVQNEPVKKIVIAGSGPESQRLQILITGGIHGNEASGPAAALLLAEEILAERDRYSNVDFTIVPLVNPLGMAKKTRRTPSQIDLNRSFRSSDSGEGENVPSEVRILRQVFDDDPFDLVLDLHSARVSRNGFFTLHVDDEDFVEKATRDFRKRWPALHGSTAPYTVTTPGVASSNNHSTFKNYALSRGASRAMTLEASAALDYIDQVSGEAALARSLIKQAMLC